MNEAVKKPLTIQEVMRHTGPAYAEFRDFPHANGPHPGILSAEKWASRVFKHYGQSHAEYGKNYRYWDGEPSKDEREAEPWEV